MAYSLADCYDVLTCRGTTPHTLFAVGGGLRSPLWAEIIASALGRSLNLIAASEHGGAIGAARLARMAVTGEAPEDIFRKPEKSVAVLPNSQWQAIYAERLALYRQLTHALLPIR